MEGGRALLHSPSQKSSMVAFGDVRDVLSSRAEVAVSPVHGRPVRRVATARTLGSAGFSASSASKSVTNARSALRMKTLDFAEQVDHSPKRYSIMASRVQRFEHPHDRTRPVTRGPGEYRTDTVLSPSMSTTLARGSRSYSSLRSSVPRFRPESPTTADLPQSEYDTEVLGKATMEKAVALSPLRYSVVSSRSKRFVKPGVQGTSSLGPGSYQAHLVKDKVARRRIRSSASFTRAKRDTGPAAAAATLANPELGPGAYVVDAKAKPLPRSPSVAFSGAQRWVAEDDFHKSLGSPLDVHPTVKENWKRGVSIPQARPFADLPTGGAGAASVTLDTGKYQSLSTAVANGQRRYSLAFRSAQPRVVDIRTTVNLRRMPSVLQPPLVPDTVGPGTYKTTMKPGMGEVQEVFRPSPSFLAVPSSGPRLDVAPALEARKRMTRVLSEASLPRRAPLGHRLSRRRARR